MRFMPPVPAVNQYRTLQDAGLRVLRSRWAPRRGVHLKSLRAVMVPHADERTDSTDQALIVCRVLRELV